MKLRTLVACLVGWCVTVGAVRAENRPPNIVFILADDLGYGELGCFGQKLIQTPHLDRMAAEGMKFTKFYAGSTVCAPSRSVLITGQHTGHTRVRGNASGDIQSLKAEDVTLAEVLKSRGFATALIGKWGLGDEGSASSPNRQGFDYFYGYLDQQHAHNPYPEFILRNEERVKLRNVLVPGSGTPKATGAGVAQEPLDFVPDLMTAEVLRWVEEQRSRPFFLFWSLITPHANNEGRKHGRGQEVPDLGAYADKEWPQPDRAHAATITRLDADIGQLFATLKRLGLDENTLVVFTSDNGHHKEGGNDPERFDANGPWRGLKRDLSDGGIRVPTIARWPARVKPGTNDAAYWFADAFPSLAVAAGATALPGKLDGDAGWLTHGLLGEGQHTPRATLYWEFHEGGFSQAVLMDERWKAIRLKRRDAAVQLFDQSSDPSEEKDIAKEHPELVARATGLFASERTETADWPIKDASLNEK